VDSVHGPWTTSGCSVHRGLALAAWTTSHQDTVVRSSKLVSGHSGAQKLTGGGRGRRGEGGEPVTRLTRSCDGVRHLVLL
jgi:hypothetical protein